MLREFAIAISSRLISNAILDLYNTIAIRLGYSYREADLEISQLVSAYLISVPHDDGPAPGSILAAARLLHPDRGASRHTTHGVT